MQYSGSPFQLKAERFRQFGNQIMSPRFTHAGFEFFAVEMAMLTFVAATTATAQPATPALIIKACSARPTINTVKKDRVVAGNDANPRSTLYLPVGRTPVGDIVVPHGASSPLRSSPLYNLSPG
jgi:ABC-type Fe3+-hydroxamate transport system substrate-binding protein